MCQSNTLGQKKLASISPIQDYPIIPSMFIKAGVAQISNKENPILFQQISKVFQTKITSPLNPSYIKMFPIISLNL